MELANKTAGQLANEALADNTKYDALEVGHAICDDSWSEFDKSVEIHLNIQSDDGRYPWRELDQFCVVMQMADDPLIFNAKRRKYYCSPFLPSPRPDQAVFLYLRSAGKIVKRLWVLPDAQTMAELSSMPVVDKRYKTMQAWSIAFFSGRFWDYIRHEHNIKMCSQQEYISHHREELIQAGCKIVDPNFTEAFDFSKIHIKKVVDAADPVSE